MIGFFCENHLAMKAYTNRLIAANSTAIEAIAYTLAAKETDATNLGAATAMLISSMEPVLFPHL